MSNVRRRLTPNRIWPVILVLFGLLCFVYGQTLGALLISPCGSLRPPFQSVRCAQPMLFVWAGYATIAAGMVLLVVPFIRKRFRRNRS